MMNFYLFYRTTGIYFPRSFIHGNITYGHVSCITPTACKSNSLMESWRLAWFLSPVFSTILYVFFFVSGILSNSYHTFRIGNLACLQIYPHIVKYGKVDIETSSLKFPVSRPCNKGEQCFLSYGNYSSSHLLTFYGFLPKGDNLYDVIPLGSFPYLILWSLDLLPFFCLNLNPFLADFDVIDDEDIGTEFSWTTHMLRGTWLSNNHNIFHYGLPTPLLNYLRRAHGLVHHSETDVSNLDHLLIIICGASVTSLSLNLTLRFTSLSWFFCKLWKNLEVEMGVLENLQSTFNDMMQNLGDLDSIDR